jgi:transposase InsO family protein
VAIDDHSRVAYVEVHRDEKAVTAIDFIKRAFARKQAQGMTIRRLMSDNGSCYRSKAFNQVLKSQDERKG